jgi:hypothetical protein
MRDRVDDRGRRGRPRSPRRSRSRSPPRRREDRDRDRGRENFDRRDRRDRDERGREHDREHDRENRQRERERERKRDATRRRSPSPERRRPPSIAEKYDSLFEGASWYAGLGDGIGGEAPASAPAPAEPGASADEPSASCAEAANRTLSDMDALKLSLLQGFLMDLVRPAPSLAGPPPLGQRAPIPRSALALTLPSCSLWRRAPRREVELPPRRHRHRHPHRRRAQEAQWRRLTRRLARGAPRA